VKNQSSKLKEMLRLYQEEKKTLEEVGKVFGISRQAVHDRLKRAGITFRPCKPQKKKLDLKTLIYLYVDKKLTIAEVAKELKSTRKKVTEELERYKIPKRSRNYSNRKHSELYELKVGKSFVMKRPNVKNPYRNLHAKAYAIGIKISVKRIDESTFSVKRLK
jgi:predicted DNA-binding protein YlxM (UPF0122 family)